MKKVEILVVEDYAHPISEKDIEEVTKKFKENEIVINRVHIPKWDIENENEVTGVYVIVREVAEV
ncbi:MAG: hypothetical protein OWQ54_03715 [Sulfolobaceae archaeon]|nr:hypothetical protein [Sulfolobaceae archaeon]